MSTFYTCVIVKHIQSLGILQKVSVVGYLQALGIRGDERTMREVDS